MASPWFEFPGPPPSTNDAPRGDKDAPRAVAARFRLFCFPYAGGGASIFRSWANWLPEEVEAVGIQLPGRETRLAEPLMLSMGPLTDELSEEMPPHLDLPFAFYGHSTGALIAFELARVLRKRGLPQPELLFLSGQDGPREKPPLIRHTLPDAEFIEILRNCKGTPDAVLQNPDLLEILLPRIRSDGAIYETYDYELQPPLDARIVIFEGTDDRFVTQPGLAAWRKETRGGFHHYAPLSGGHFFLHAEEDALARHINQELGRLLYEPACSAHG